MLELGLVLVGELRGLGHVGGFTDDLVRFAGILAEASSRCWSPAARSAPSTIESLGCPFPAQAFADAL
jgi:hypothetical protein